MDNETIWCSIDPANVSGVAYWRGDKLASTVVVRKVGTKGKYAVCGDVFPNKWDAWSGTLSLQQTVVCEEGFGDRPKAIGSQSFLRGFVSAICHYRKSFHPCEFKVVNVSEWRRVIKEAYGVSWPATTERKKALSVQLVKTHFGLDLTNDEADAVLLGVAAMRMGLVNG